jgi:hypothetical protein
VEQLPHGHIEGPTPGRFVAPVTTLAELASSLDPLVADRDRLGSPVADAVLAVNEFRNPGVRHGGGAVAIEHAYPLAPGSTGLRGDLSSLMPAIAAWSTLRGCSGWFARFEMM